MSPKTTFATSVAAVVAILAVGAASAVAAIPKPPGANPGDRGYEKVTPADKGGVDIAGESYRGYHQAAAGGDALLYPSIGVFAGGPTGGYPSYYVARRGTTRWSSASASLPGTASIFGVSAFSSPGRTPMVMHVDDELEHAVIESNGGLDGALPGVPNLFTRDLASGAYSRLTPSGPTFVDALSGVLFMGNDAAPYYEAASSDGRHVVFASSWPFTDSAPSTSSNRLFRVSGGDVDLVSTMPDGTPAEYAQAGSGPMSTHNAVSEDGARVYFTTSNTSFGDVYMWEDGEGTTVVSDIGEALYVTATPDGSKALFSRRTFGGDPGTGVWRFDAESGESEMLASGEAIITAASSDLEIVYLTSRFQLLEGEPGFALNEYGLYLWRDGELSEIGRLSDASGDDPLTSLIDLPYGTYPPTNAWISQGHTRWTPDGETLVFDTTARVTGFDSNGFRQVYRYDVETDEIACLSCPPSTPNGDAVLYMKGVGHIGTHARPLGDRNSISRDGRRVFFSTGDALVPHDVNNRVDVYVAEEGAVHLISDGLSKFDARFVEASADGDDVYFATAARLVAADHDDLVDIYDARVGGGFPEPTTDPARCSGDGCQGDATPPARSPGAGSADLRGAGDAGTPARTSVRIRTLTARQKRGLSSGRAIAVRIFVPRAGTVRAIATARAMGKRRVVARGRARAGKAGTVAVRLRLSRAARTQLRRTGRLALRLKARSSGRAAKTTIRLAR